MRLRRGFGRFGQRGLGAVAEGLEALLADVFLELVFRSSRICGALRAMHSEVQITRNSQDQQEPPGAVDRVEPCGT